MYNGYLQIEGIPGESTDEKHKNWIEILSFNMGAHQPVSGSVSSAGGRTSQRANFEDFSVVKSIDKASVPLFVHCANGKHIPKIILELYRSGGDDPVMYLRYTFEKSIVSSVRAGGTSDGGESVPVESVSFNYSTVYVEYDQQALTGAGTGVIAGGWDLGENKVK